LTDCGRTRLLPLKRWRTLTAAEQTAISSIVRCSSREDAVKPLQMQHCIDELQLIEKHDRIKTSDELRFTLTASLLDVDEFP
jgi:hypothetical protein